MVIPSLISALFQTKLNATSFTVAISEIVLKFHLQKKKNPLGDNKMLSYIFFYGGCRVVLKSRGGTRKPKTRTELQEICYDFVIFRLFDKCSNTGIEKQLPGMQEVYFR